MKITDTDRGASYLMRRAADLARGARISVGVPENAGDYPNGTPVVTVAAAHEFGLGTAPQRSFIRGWYDSKGNAKLTADLASACQGVLLRGAQLSPALASLGGKYVAEIRKRMDAHIAPSLAPETVARKARSGSATPSTPLEDTHRLRAAINYKIELK